MEKSSSQRAMGRDEEMNTRWQTVVGVVILVLLGGVAAVFGVRYALQASHLGKFKSHIQEYTAVGSARPDLRQNGTAKGKMITVKLQGPEIDWLYYDLPKSLRANSPEEVQTVVLLDWKENVVNQYEGGGNAIQWICGVTVYDKDTKTPIAYGQYAGGDPPSTTSTSAGSNDYGSKPTAEIVRFLQGLVR
jgi:hypothetical protein